MITCFVISGLELLDRALPGTIKRRDIPEWRGHGTIVWKHSGDRSVPTHVSPESRGSRGIGTKLHSAQ